MTVSTEKAHETDRAGDFPRGCGEGVGRFQDDVDVRAEVEMRGAAQVDGEHTWAFRFSIGW